MTCARTITGWVKLLIVPPADTGLEAMAIDVLETQAFKYLIPVLSDAIQIPLDGMELVANEALLDLESSPGDLGLQANTVVYVQRTKTRQQLLDAFENQRAHVAFFDDLLNVL
jgi:hypothetical protein